MRSLLPLPLPLLLLFSAFFLSLHALAPPRKKILAGGWAPIADLKDPHVREIAEFAVAEHNKQGKASLTLCKVVRGESQVVAGVNYRLVLQVADGSGAKAEYEAVVWEKPWENFRQLTSFRKLVIVGGWTPIKNVSDPHVHEIAEFAVAEHNNKTETDLTLTKVVKGETQVVAGIKYKLVLMARDGRGASAKYEAVVWEKAWQNFKQLTSFKLLD